MCQMSHVKIYNQTIITQMITARHVNIIYNQTIITQTITARHVSDVTCQQTGSNDCGLFAIANATELCFGGNPSSVIYDQASMRKHLLNCFLQDKLTPFPKEDVRVEISSEVDGTSEIEVYCSCRLPEDKKQRMAKCMKCLEWFHEKCLKIPKSVFSRKSTYNCPDCTGP